MFGGKSARTCTLYCLWPERWVDLVLRSALRLVSLGPEDGELLRWTLLVAVSTAMSSGYRSSILCQYDMKCAIIIDIQCLICYCDDAN